MARNKYPYEIFIQDRVAEHLISKGYSIQKNSELHGHGVDIKARNEKYSRYWLVEVKGGSSSKNAKSVNTNNFVFGLGQILTRIQSVVPPKATAGSNKYGVAYPDEFKKFLRSQRLHWNLCKNLNLYIFFVRKNGDVEEYNWERVKESFIASKRGVCDGQT